MRVINIIIYYNDIIYNNIMFIFIYLMFIIIIDKNKIMKILWKWVINVLILYNINLYNINVILKYRWNFLVEGYRGIILHIELWWF